MTDREKVEVALKASLKSGAVTSMFVDDVLKLWQVDRISPEVILRELRALEGLAPDPFDIEGDEPIKVWLIAIGGSPDAPQPELEYRRSLTATKDATCFDREGPLKGLWHKHYYVHTEDFIDRNVRNQRRRHREFNLSPLAAMMTRIEEERLTGEWIVFRMEGGVRTYLCLAKHSANKADDQKLADRISKA